ncbi:MAG: ABC transporter permease [Actinomycetaceae bacterium]|nr:ABC transporter permease [Actinomycetaceae bacterium]
MSTRVNTPAFTAPPVASVWNGLATFTWYSFWKVLSNPFSIGFAILMPIFMYLMFAVGRDYSDIMVGNANVSAIILVNMATYGMILTTSSLAATVALERTSGVSRLYALTPISGATLLIARLVASMAVTAVVIAITYTVGYFTGSKMEWHAWIGTMVMIVVLSILPAALGFAAAYLVRSDAAFGVTSAFTVVSAFGAGIFIPLEQMGEFFKMLAPNTPFYGLSQLTITPVYGWSELKGDWVGNYLIWTVIFVLLAIWGQRRDTGRQ